MCDGFEQGLGDWRIVDEGSGQSLIVSAMDSNSFLSFVPSRLQPLQGGYAEVSVLGADEGQLLSSQMRFRVDGVENAAYWWLNVFTLADPSGRQWNLDIQRGDDDRFRFDLRRWSPDESDMSLSEQQFEPGRWYCVDLVLQPESARSLELLVDGQPVIFLEGPKSEDRALSYAAQLGSSRVEEPQNLPTVNFDDVTISRAAPSGC